MMEPNPLAIIAEDESRLLGLYKRWLEKASFRVQEAQNGSWALTHIELDRPDCIILDLGLPCLDGVEVCRQLKSSDKTRHIPVIAITGRVDEGLHKSARQAGADVVLIKPFGRSELLSAIRSVIATHYREDCNEEMEDRIEQMKRNAWARLARAVA